MSKEMVISANPHETRVAILEEGQLCEYYVEREKEFALVGSIYKGKVTRVLPGMQSAFVEIGLDSDAFLYVSDFLEDIEEFDHIVTTVEDKAQKMEAQGGQVFAAPGATTPALEPTDVEAVPFPADDASHSEFADAQPLSIAPDVTQREPSHAPPPSRPRYENRSPGGHGGGDRGGRNFRGRSGRGGRNFRRDGRGGERKFGRELPSSKYATSRPYEENSAEPAAEGHVSIILPGESLAKYRDKPAASGISAVEPAENVARPIHTEASDHFAQEPSETQPSAYQPPAQRSPVTYTKTQDSSARLASPIFPARRPSSSSTGLEPLPGEKLSKWKAHQHLPIDSKEDIDSLPVPEAVRFAPLAPLSPLEQTETEDRPSHDSQESHDSGAEQEPSADRETHFGRESLDTAHTHADHLPSDLSEDEVTALAEHIAEAQDDAAARVAQDRVFAAADAADAQGSETDAEVEAEEIDAAEQEAEEEVEHEDSHLSVSEHDHTDDEHSDDLHLADEHLNHTDQLEAEDAEHSEHADSEAQLPANDPSMLAKIPGPLGSRLRKRAYATISARVCRILLAGDSAIAGAATTAIAVRNTARDIIARSSPAERSSLPTC